MLPKTAKCASLRYCNRSSSSTAIVRASCPNLWKEAPAGRGRIAWGVRGGGCRWAAPRPAERERRLAGGRPGTSVLGNHSFGDRLEAYLPLLRRQAGSLSSASLGTGWKPVFRLGRRLKPAEDRHLACHLCPPPKKAKTPAPPFQAIVLICGFHARPAAMPGSCSTPRTLRSPEKCSASDFQVRRSAAA